MNPFLLTLTFLTLMTILTSSEMIQFSHNSIEKHLHHNYVERIAETERAHAVALYEMHHSQDEKSDQKKERSRPFQSSEKKPRSLHLCCECPPENSRISLPILFDESPLSKNLPNGFSYYEVMAQLIRTLYGQHPYFRALSRAEYRILDTLIAYKEEIATFDLPEQLSSLPFDHPDLHDCFYNMLKGPPSLLDFLTCKTGFTREEVKINLPYADARIIEAVFAHHPRLAQQVITLRDQWMEEVIEQEAQRKTRDWKEGEWRKKGELKEQLRTAFKELMRREHLDETAHSNLFDFCLRSRGEIVYITDPLTQRTTRKHCPPKEKKTPENTLG